VGGGGGGGGWGGGWWPVKGTWGKGDHQHKVGVGNDLLWRYGKREIFSESSGADC